MKPFTKTLLSLGLLLSSLTAFADDTVLPIEIQPTPPPSTPTEKPQTPISVNLSCYTIGHNLYVDATNNVMGLIEVTDEAGSLVYQTYTIIGSGSCINLDGFYGSFTISIEIDGLTYVGYFQL